MLELLYPIIQAPRIPASRYSMSDGKSTPKNEEMLPVVEPTGIVVGRSPRSYLHSGSKLLHPVVHLHIIDRFSRIYLQKRSKSKDLYPGRWDTAVGGHVTYGEQIGEALYREAAEELGFYDFNPVFLDTYVFESDVEKELISVFATVGNFDIRPDNSEVDEGRFWTPEEIEAAVGKGILTPIFEQEYGAFREKLQSLL